MHKWWKTQNGRKLLLAGVLILFAGDEARAGAAPLPAGKPFFAEQLLSAPATARARATDPAPGKEQAGEERLSKKETHKKETQKDAAASPPPAPSRKPSRPEQTAHAPEAAKKTADDAESSAGSSAESDAGSPAEGKDADRVAAIAPAAGAAMARAVKAPTAAPPAARAAAPRAPLSARDAATYKKIFALQTEGEWKKADRLLDGMRDTRLRGHVLEQRYLHPSYKADFEELVTWLALYGDHPGASRIYRLANVRKPKTHSGSIPKPSNELISLGLLRVLSDGHGRYEPEGQRSQNTKKEVSRIVQSIRADLAQGAPSRALKRLNADYTRKLLDDTEYDQVRALIAGSYMYEGKHRKAAELAHASARRSGANAPMAGWVSGLVAWRQGHYQEAAGYFEQTASSRYASTWMASAGAYWASRAHFRAGNVQDVSPWLRRAAQHPRTFYGLIATRALGWDFDFNWDMPDFTAAHRARIEAIPAGRRAVALVAAEQYHLAERELRQIDTRKDDTLREALLAYAGSRDLPSYAMKLAESVPHPKGGLYDAALYPVSPWQPREGYTVDRALIHALIRQESRFNPWAESRSGAMGLMQLMPATASYVSGRHGLREAEGRHTLKDPQVNLDIGQRYVETLLKQNNVNGELFSLAMAYNAGPGNMRRWKNQLSDVMDDPLLFVESIPIAETRAFVERVMANYWIYRLRLNQPTPSLDAIAGGQWARYVQQDNDKAAAPEKTAMNGWAGLFR